jgi:predicted RNA-binding Zn-ribbon protein involved in translation (DUF1610 family)
MTSSIPCPRCGTPMNHQANKLIDPVTREEAEASGLLGGILVVVFACPGCGYIASLRDERADR